MDDLAGSNGRPKLQWRTQKLKARTQLPSEVPPAIIWQSDPLIKHSFEAASTSRAYDLPSVASLSAFSWTTNSLPDSQLPASKRNAMARYQVPLGRRPHPQILAAVRHSQLNRAVRCSDTSAHGAPIKPETESPPSTDLETTLTSAPSDELIRRRSLIEPPASTCKAGANDAIKTTPTLKTVEATTEKETSKTPATSLSGEKKKTIPRRREAAQDVQLLEQSEKERRRQRSDAIAQEMQRRRTERIDVLSRQPSINPRESFEDARRISRDAEVASIVTAAALVAEEQQKRREMNVRRSRMRTSAAGEQLISQADVAHLLAVHRPDQDRDNKRKCAQTISRWAACHLNDERLLKEGAVNAAARLALEDDDLTRKFSAVALRNFAKRQIFWDALLQPHVLSTIRELLNEDAHDDSRLQKDKSMSYHLNVPSESGTANTAARDAAIALIQLTMAKDVRLSSDGTPWEGRLVDKGIHLLLQNGAERHVGLAEGVACALFNLTCVKEPHPQMDRVTRTLVQMPGIATNAKVRMLVAQALRNLATHPSLTLRMIEEGVVQRINQLASAALTHLQVCAAKRGVQVSGLHDEDDDDDALREACMWVLLRFAQTSVVRMDVLLAGANRAILALLTRPPSTRPSVANVAGWGAMTLALLSEATGAFEVMAGDKGVDASRAVAMAVERGIALGQGNQGPVFASVRAATNVAMSVAMISNSTEGRAMLMAPYKAVKKIPEAVTFIADNQGTCAAQDIFSSLLGPRSPLTKCKPVGDGVELPWDNALRYTIITLAQMLSDEQFGLKVVALAVKTHALESISQICCHQEVQFPSVLWTSSADVFASTAVDPIVLLRQQSHGSIDGLFQAMYETLEQDESFRDRDNNSEGTGAVEDLGNTKEDDRVPVIPISKLIAGACALVFDRVSTFKSVSNHNDMCRALVPGIVSLAQRVHELVAQGWSIHAATTASTVLTSPAWCLACCAAALGRLAVSQGPRHRDRPDDNEAPLCPARISVVNGALDAIVQTLQMLHHACTQPAPTTEDMHYVTAAMRTLIAVREIALEPGVVQIVAKAVVPAALQWYGTTHPGTTAAVTSLFAAFSRHRECRQLLLENGILSALFMLMSRGNNRIQKAYCGRHGEDNSSDTLAEGNTSTLGDAQGDLETCRDHKSVALLCCAVTLANMSLDPQARFRMVFEKTAKTVSALSDTSYGEENQLACARALCNLCSTVAEQARNRNQEGNRDVPGNSSPIPDVVTALIDQKVVSAVAMIGAVRASRNNTRRSCAAALANLMAPCGKAAHNANTLERANEQGLIPTLVRLCRINDIPTKAYAACAIARLSETTAGRDFLASRPLVLRVLFSESGINLYQREACSDWSQVNAETAFSSGRSSCHEVYVRDIDVTDGTDDDTQFEEFLLQQRSLLRVACRLICGSTHCRSVAIESGSLFHLSNALTLPEVTRLPELLACLEAIEACARSSHCRLKMIASARLIDALATFANENHIEPNSDTASSTQVLRDMSHAAQKTIESLLYDSQSREAVANHQSIVHSLVAVTFCHAKKNFDFGPAVVVARSLLCVLLAVGTPSKLKSIIESGILKALVALGTRQNAEPRAISSMIDPDSPRVAVLLEIAAVIMSALRIISERGAGVYYISMSLRNEGATEIAANFISNDLATFVTKPHEDQVSNSVQMWAYTAYIRAYATIYSFARHHESLRANLDDVVLAAMTTVSSGILRCPATEKAVRSWTIATLALMLSDPTQRNLLASHPSMITSLICAARDELQSASGSDLVKSPMKATNNVNTARNTRTCMIYTEPAIEPLPSSTEKNLVWCFYQAAQVAQKRVRQAMQDAVVLLAQLERKKCVSALPWLVAASKEASRLLATELYERAQLTQDGVLNQLLSLTFRTSSDEAESKAHALLRQYENAERIALSLQPIEPSVTCMPHEPRGDATASDDKIATVPEETNDVFLCEGAEMGPVMENTPPLDHIDYAQLAPNGDIQTYSEVANCSQNTPGQRQTTSSNMLRSSHSSRAFRRSREFSKCGFSNYAFTESSMAFSVYPCLEKMCIPRCLVAVSEADERKLAEVVGHNLVDSDKESDDATEERLQDLSEPRENKFWESSTAEAENTGRCTSTISVTDRVPPLASQTEAPYRDWSQPVRANAEVKKGFLIYELSRISFLQHLSRSEIRFLAAAMTRVEFAEGTRFVAENTVTAGLYIIEEGCCKLFHSNGHVQTIPAPGESDDSPTRHIGELSVVHEHKSNMSAVAMSDLVAWFLDRTMLGLIMRPTEHKKRILYKQFVDNLPLFKELSPKNKDCVCTALVPRDYKKGDILIRQGDVGHDFFILEEGSVECFRDVSGQMMTLAPYIGSGAFFGELALLRNSPRSATIRALEDVSVFTIDCNTFNDTIKRVNAIHVDYGSRADESIMNSSKECTLRDQTRSTPTNEQVFSNNDSVHSANQTNKNGSSIADVRSTSEDDSSDEDSEDADDRDGILRKLRKMRGDKRDNVYVKPHCFAEAWMPPKHAKTADEALFLGKQLSQLFFLKHLDRREIGILVGAMRKVTFQSNATIIRQGDQGEHLYIIESGYCRVTMNGTGIVCDIPDDQGAKFNGSEPRRHIGELALLYDKPRGASVFTLSEVQAWCLDRGTFKSIVQLAANKRREIYFDFISQVPLFSNFDETQKSTICDALQPEHFDKGDILIREAEPSEHFFIIEEGKVVATRLVNGRQVRLGTPLSRGSFFGDTVLIRDEVGNATITALKETSILKLHRDTFKRLIGHIPSTKRTYNNDSGNNSHQHSGEVGQVSNQRNGTSGFAKPAVAEIGKPTGVLDSLRSVSSGQRRTRESHPNSLLRLKHHKSRKKLLPITKAGRAKVRTGSLLCMTKHATPAQRRLLESFLGDNTRKKRNFVPQPILAAKIDPQETHVKPTPIPETESELNSISFQVAAPLFSFGNRDGSKNVRGDEPRSAQT